MAEEKTLGQIRIRPEFNPGGNECVQLIKDKSCELIDSLEFQLDEKLGFEKNAVKDMERTRLTRLAQTHYEMAAMWAVKAVTL